MAAATEGRVRRGQLTRRELLLGTGLALAGLGGCGTSQPLRVALQSWCGYQFIRLAAREGWYGDSIQIVDSPTAAESVRALATGAADVAGLTLDEVLVLAEQGVDLRVILIADVSSGADVVLAHPEVGNIAGLRGKRIGVEATSLGAIMIAELLDAAGLQRQDVEVVAMGEDHLRAWQAQPLDAIVTYEPARSRLTTAGLVPIFDSRSLPQTIIDVVAVRRDAELLHGPQLKTLVAGHFRALELWRTNPIDTAYRLAPFIGVAPEQVADVYQGLDLPDVAYNLHDLAGPSDDLRRSTVKVAQILARAGLMRAASIPDPLYTEAYLPGVP